MSLRSKLTSEIHQKLGRLGGKIKQNRLKAPTLVPFSQKMHLQIIGFPENKEKKNVWNAVTYN